MIQRSIPISVPRSIIVRTTHDGKATEDANNLLRFGMFTFFFMAAIGLALFLSASIPNMFIALFHIVMITLFAGMAGMFLFQTAVQRQTVYSLMMAVLLLAIVIVIWISFIQVLRVFGPTSLLVGITLSPILTMCPLGLGIYEQKEQLK